jgi:phosphomevalonate kinase
MRAKAPGKVVLSGAYAVLHGAPAIVAAVDRYVFADSSVAGDFLTDEVKAAGFVTPYWFDASELRRDGRKLGLGSSAAILVATLGAQELASAPDLQPASLASRVYARGLEAHRIAQGGGSGLDVTASCYGGILLFALGSGAKSLRRLANPRELSIEIWASNAAASTQSMLAAVRAFAARDRAGHDRDISAQSEAAQTTADAWQDARWSGVISGLNAQRRALQQLGADAGIPIVTREVQALAAVAERNGAAVLPAGAGGGDIALYVGEGPSTFMSNVVTECGHSRLPVTLGSTGVQADRTTTRQGHP